MRCLRSFLLLLFVVLPLSAQGLFDTPLTLTNKRPDASPKQLPLATSIEFAFSMGSWQSELSSVDGFSDERNPSNSVRLFKLGYTRFFSSGLGFSGSVLREEEGGWGVRAEGQYRLEPGKLSPVGEEGILLSAGVFLVKNKLYSDDLTLDFCWGVEWGHRFGTFIRLNVEGFFFVPWSPGFELSDNSRFRLDGQLRLGGLGLFASLDLLNRGFDRAGDKNIRCTTFKGGLVVFSAADWMLQFGGGLMQKSLLEGMGASNQLASFRDALFGDIGFTRRYRNRAGQLYTYSWGVQLILWQSAKDALISGTLWESGAVEAAFWFAASVSL